MRTYFPPQLLNPAQQTGRWAVRDIDDDQVLYTTNLGSYLRCRVTGSHQLILTVANHHSDLGPGQVYALRVDGNLWRRFPARQEKITVPLTPAPHIIEIMAAGNTDLDEVWTGKQGFAIRSLAVDDAGILTAAPTRPVIDFIGDSITGAMPQRTIAPRAITPPPAPTWSIPTVSELPTRLAESFARLLAVCQWPASFFAGSTAILRGRPTIPNWWSSTSG